MADNLARYGFRFHKGRSAPYLVPVREKVASGYQGQASAVNVPLRIGDPVFRTTDGTMIISAAGTGRISGVIVGVEPYWDGTKMVFGDRLPGGTAGGTTIVDRFSYVMVIPAQGAVFEVDVDDTVNTTLAAYQAHVGANADHAFSGVVSSGAFPKLDISTADTTATLQWRILEVSGTGDNRDFSGANVKMLVTANLTAEAPAYPTGV